MSDTNWQFPPQFDKPGKPPRMVSGAAAIDQSIYIILKTRINERLLDKTFGSNLDTYVFEPIDNMLLADIREEVADAIETHEPRIALDDINFDTGNLYQDQLIINLSYHLKQDDTQQRTMDFPLTTQRG
ncbi:MAG: GPW/gp25 family protein [Pseudomonadota bacterium]